MEKTAWNRFQAKLEESPLTIKDLAARTGYAVGTVSRVLNGHPHVSEKARTAILQAVEETGFSCNLNARQLKQHHSASIGLVARAADPLAQQFIRAIDAARAPEDSPLILAYAEPGESLAQRAQTLSQEKKPLGLLILTGAAETLPSEPSGLTVPWVLVGQCSQTQNNWVCMDAPQAAYAAVRTLLELGHRRIALLAPESAESGPNGPYFAGYRQALQDWGLDWEPRFYQASAADLAAGYQAAQAIPFGGSGATALVAPCAALAIGAIRALADRGIQVPQAVSVITLEHHLLGEYLTPRLATVAADPAELGRQALALLLEQIRQPGSPRGQIVPFSLSTGESLAPPREPEES